VFGDPFFVVLDEPNANLDADGENALSRAIEALRASGSIVIVISHRPSALAALNMALILHQGRVIAFGPKEDMFARLGGASSPSPVQAAPTTDTPASKPNIAQGSPS
jgi:ABC-type protease/lipase transport system fused ATPase/permease subunit